MGGGEEGEGRGRIVSPIVVKSLLAMPLGYWDEVRMKEEGKSRLSRTSNGVEGG